MSKNVLLFQITILFGAFFFYDFGNVFLVKRQSLETDDQKQIDNNKHLWFYGVVAAAADDDDKVPLLSLLSQQKNDKLINNGSSIKSKPTVRIKRMSMGKVKVTKVTEMPSNYASSIIKLSSGSSICPMDCSCLGNYLQCEKLQLRNVPIIPEWVNNIELSHNYLGDAVDQYIGNLTNLIGLELNDNEIGKFPVFYRLNSLESLQLAHNQIKMLASPPEGILSLPKLKHLDLSHNRLETILPNSFPVINQLRQINLNNNLIKNLIGGSQSFGNLKSLRRLELSSNQLEKIPWQTFANLTALRILKLRNNSIGVIEPNTFLNLHKLQILELDSNQLIKIESATFQNLSSLSTLSLTKNQITIIERNSWRSQFNLKYLDLSFNRLANITIEMFQQLPSIIDLNLMHNQIVRIDSGAFSNIGNLMGTLNLNGNQLNFNWIGTSTSSTLTTSTSTLTTSITDDADDVDEENVDEEEIDSYEMEMEMEEHESNQMNLQTSPFYGLKNLRNLQLESNQIDLISASLFSSLNKLEVLNLNGNPIKSIEFNALIDGLKQLIDIKLNTMSLNCDCKLLWFSNWLKIQIGQSSKLKNRMGHGFPNVIGVCANPPELRELNVRTVNAEHFICSRKRWIKPQIIEEPHSMVINQGQSRNITCTAESPINDNDGNGNGNGNNVNVDVQFLWKHENEILNNGKIGKIGKIAKIAKIKDAKIDEEIQKDLQDFYEIHQEIIVLRNLNNMTVQQSTLRLLNVSRQRGHHGRYQCLVSNSHGTVHSQKIKITIGSLPEFTKIPMDITLNATDTARLECAAGGDPKPQIYWQKDGGDDFPAARERRLHVMQNDDVFFITNAKLSDMGLYTCTAENTVGIVRANATLRVHERPSFVKQMQMDKNVQIGMTTVLECMAAGSPKPILLWLKDRKPIQRTERHFFAADDQLLIIVDTKLIDAGLYQCEMSNYIQTIAGYTQLNVFNNNNNNNKDQQRSIPVNRILSLNGYRIVQDQNQNQNRFGKMGTKGQINNVDEDGNRNDDEINELDNHLSRSKINAINIDEMTSIVVITVVCCAVGTSIVWVIIIYQTRKRRRRHHHHHHHQQEHHHHQQHHHHQHPYHHQHRTSSIAVETIMSTTTTTTTANVCGSSQILSLPLSPPKPPPPPPSSSSSSSSSGTHLGLINGGGGGGGGGGGASGGYGNYFNCNGIGGIGRLIDLPKNDLSSSLSLSLSSASATTTTAASTRIIQQPGAGGFNLKSLTFQQLPINDIQLKISDSNRSPIQIENQLNVDQNVDVDENNENELNSSKLILISNDENFIINKNEFKLNKVDIDIVDNIHIHRLVNNENENDENENGNDDDENQLMIDKSSKQKLSFISPSSSTSTSSTPSSTSSPSSSTSSITIQIETEHLVSKQIPQYNNHKIEIKSKSTIDRNPLQPFQRTIHQLEPLTNMLDGQLQLNSSSPQIDDLESTIISNELSTIEPFTSTTLTTLPRNSISREMAKGSATQPPPPPPPPRFSLPSPTSISSSPPPIIHHHPRSNQRHQPYRLRLPTSTITSISTITPTSTTNSTPISPSSPGTPQTQQQQSQPFQIPLETNQRWPTMEFHGIISLNPNIDNENPNIDNKNPNIDNKNLNVDNKNPNVDNKNPNVDNKNPNIDNKNPNVDLDPKVDNRPLSTINNNNYPNHHQHRHHYHHYHHHHQHQPLGISIGISGGIPLTGLINNRLMNRQGHQRNDQLNLMAGTVGTETTTTEPEVEAEEATNELEDGQKQNEDEERRRQKQQQQQQRQRQSKIHLLSF